MKIVGVFFFIGIIFSMPFLFKFFSIKVIDFFDFLYINREYLEVVFYFLYFSFIYILFLFCIRLLPVKFYSLNSLKVSEEDNNIWKKIISKIESTHHTSILAKVKDLDTETKINFPKFNPKYDFSLVYVNKIREFIILFEAVLEKLQHRDIAQLEESRGEIDIYREFIIEKLKDLYIHKYLFKSKIIFFKIVPYFISYIFILIYLHFLYRFNIIDLNFLNDYKNFFTGLLIIILAIPTIFLIVNFIQFSFMYASKKLNFYFLENTILYIVGQILVMLFIIITIIAGLRFINSIEYEPFKIIFSISRDIIFSSEVIDEKTFYKVLKLNSLDHLPSYILIAKLIIGIMGTFVVFNLINRFIKKYDQFFYEQKIKRYLLPPELIKVLGYIFVILIAIFYIYYMSISYPYYKKKISIKPNEDKHVEKRVQKNKSIEDLLPFGLFLALFGTLLSISSRDIIVNYFSGLSMKMNSPYDIGDRVTIDSSKILEVIDIGLRNDKFYEIATNSIVSIPHSKLAKSVIKNYTYPTLDYRNSLNIYIEHSNEFDRANYNLPRRAEKLLLTSAFINTGVKLPKIDKKIVEELNSIWNMRTLFYRFQEERHSKIENILDKGNKYFTSEINKIWNKFEEINSTILDKNRGKYFFKDIFVENLPFRDNDVRINLSIKKAIIAIVCSVIEYQEMIENVFYSRSDKHGIRRKYMIFDGVDSKEIDRFANILVDISFYYYMLANRLWELKEEQTSFSQKKKIDRSMTQILNVPRVSSKQEVHNEKVFWKVVLLVTLELSEQSDETIHHINMYIDKLWNIFIPSK